MSKRKKLILFLSITTVVLLISTIVLFFVFKNSQDTDDNEVPDVVLVPTGNFEVDLFRQSFLSSEGGNIVISPLSVKIAMSMATEGAYGDSLKELNSVIGLDDNSKEYFKGLLVNISDEDEVIFHIANSVWAREGLEFKKIFLEDLVNYYQAEARVLDFTEPSAKDVINAWVSRKTEEKIDSIVDEITPEHIMFLINAIYFKGEWQSEFDEDLTEEKDFTLLDGSKVSTDLMYMSSEFQYQESEEFQAVELPYGENERYVMRVYLLKEGEELEEFVSDLTRAKLVEWASRFRLEEGTLQLPKFKSEYSSSLKDVLQMLGIVEAFDPIKANFDRMINVPEENVYLSDVKHKTYIEVNEKGTEAAAVTSVEVGITSITNEAPESFEMIVDRPFLFTIDDTENNLILFMGIIFDPTK